MKLPALFYGLYREVKRRTSKIVTQIRRDKDWIALVEAEGFLDIESTPGLIVMHGPSPLLSGQSHFQMWLPWSQLRAKVEDAKSPLLQRVFDESLTRPWTVLGLVARGNHSWFIQRERLRPFLQTVRQYWDTYAELGPRYTNGSDMGDELWSIPNNVTHALAKLGISNEVLNKPLPPGGLGELIDETEHHLTT